jgi:hypothetical protein
MQGDKSDAYIAQFIDACRKLKDEALARDLPIKAAVELKDPSLKEKHLKQLKVYDVKVS